MTKTKVVSRLSLLLGVLALSTVSLVSTAASASSSPTEPSVGSPIGEWQAWASSLNDVTTSTDWTSVANNSGCQLVASSIVTANDVALGIPSGVSLDGIALQLKCGAGSPVSAMSGSTAVSPDYATNCPVFEYWNGASITNGYECVGTYASGTQAYTGAEYTYETTGSVRGHEELGTYSSSCAPGTAAANSPTVTLDEGYAELVAIPVDYSDNWSATWWKGTGSPYTNWGTVCGSY